MIWRTRAVVAAQLLLHATSCPAVEPAAASCLVQLLQHQQQQTLWPAQRLVPHQPPAAAIAPATASPLLSQHQQWWHRSYHPATHAARALTSKLLQQQTWQDLRLLFDASGGGSRFAPIQLCALLQQLARRAPAPELLTAADRGDLQRFADELLAAAVLRLNRFDAVGLATVVSSALKLGCPISAPHSTLHMPQDGSEAAAAAAAAAPGSTSSSGIPTTQQQQQQDPLSLYAKLLAAATKQVAHANPHEAGMLLAALTSLQQHLHEQQQQQSTALQQHQQLSLWQQQLELWEAFAAALTQRLQACAAAQPVSSADASKLCLTASRLCGLLARQRHQAMQALSTASSAAGTQSSTGGVTRPQLQQLYSRLQQQLRHVLAFAVQQVVQGADDSAAAAAETASVESVVMTDTSRVLFAAARAGAWPGWPALLALLQRFAGSAAQASSLLPALGASQQVGRGKRQRQPQPQLGLAALGIGLTHSGHPTPAGDAGSASPAEAAAAAVRDSVGPLLWAVGRMAEQQQQQQQQRGRWSAQEDPLQQQQQQRLAEELLHHAQVWQTLSPVLGACQQQLHAGFGPLQLAQVATGLGKLAHSSRALLAQATAPGDTPASSSSSIGSQAAASADTGVDAAAGGSDDPTAAAAASALQAHLSSPELRRLLQQHVGRVEMLLPLLLQQHRQQLAAAYEQLGVQLPRSVASVFERDAAQRQMMPVMQGSKQESHSVGCN